MRPELQKKIEQAIKLLKSTCEKRGIVEVAYSGGKDSDVILQLCKEAGIQYRAIYKNTTIDPPGTIKHAEDMGVEIVRPKHSFFELISKNGYPGQFRRFCCRFLKEYKVLDTAVIGIRQSESKRRKNRYKEPTACRLFSKKENDKVYQIFPILTWTDKDVAEYIEDRGIKCHPLYYDDNGKFHAERRLGCQGCPLKSRKKRLEEFKKNPKMLRAWIRAGIKYKFREYDAYEMMAIDLFYDRVSEFKNANRKNLFEDHRDWKNELETYFGIDLTIN